MKNQTLLTWGIVLAVAGIIGMTTVVASGPGPSAPRARTPRDEAPRMGAPRSRSPRSRSPRRTDGFTSAGQRIYYTGRDAQGRLIPRTIGGWGMMGPGMMAGLACVDCHAEDGRGGGIGMMAGVIDVPDIRYSALSSPSSDETTPAAGWNESDIARAIREGVEPDGERLQPPMPRWDMSDSEIEAVIGYLKELD